MLHKMKLYEDAFNLIKQGFKTIEMRLYDEKRSKIKVDDVIKFSLYSDKNKTLAVKVVNLYKFNNFSELYSNFDKTSLGYKKTDVCKSSDMEKYYSLEKQSNYGVLAIKIKLL